MRHFRRRRSTERRSSSRRLCQRASLDHSTEAAYTLPSSFDRRARMAASAEVLQGTLDLLVLKSLSIAPLHGWGISQRIQQLSRDALRIGQGSLYPALYRLERKGFVKSEWGTTDNNREAKYYQLSAAGRRALADELSDWRRFVSAVDLVLVAES